MEVKLDRDYPLDVDAARAWQVLGDVPVVAACMPGAAITAQDDATHWQGTVRLKVGPAVASFAGQIELRELDPAQRRLRMIGRGADRGGSTAAMELDAALLPGDTPERSVLSGHATVTVNGKLAQFGGRMMVQVSDVLLAQFVDNFRAAAQALPVPAPAADGPAPALADGAPLPAGDATASAAQGAPAAPAPVASAAPPPAREINVLALAWAVLKSWLSALFRRAA